MKGFGRQVRTSDSTVMVSKISKLDNVFVEKGLEKQKKRSINFFKSFFFKFCCLIVYLNLICKSICLNFSILDFAGITAF